METDLLAAAPALLLALAVLVLPALPPEHAAGRAIGAALTAVLLVRYLLWRGAETLPAFEDGAAPLAVAGTLVAHAFFAVEAVGGVACLLLLHVVSRTVDRRAEADAHPVETHPGGPPLIDVLIPTYNESRAILERTIVGAAAQNYPRFRVWVLDDGRRPWLAELAASHGAHYLTRTDNAHGKAGNMNAALRRILALPEPPDAVAVLDADFVPTPAFLRRAAALLHDSRTGCVQTPQFFFNPDPIQLNLRGLGALADEQRFFFDVVLPSKDAHGTAFSCGTSALIRAEALRAVGLFPTESVTEDMLLSIKLRAAGWRTVYLKEPLTVGLAPEGLGEYLTQRGRWCLGTMQIMRCAWGPFARASGVPLVLRLHTLDSGLFWTVGPLMRVLCLTMPVLHWWLGLTVMDATAEGLILHLGPYWIAIVCYMAWISRGTNVPILGEAVGLLVTRETLRATVAGLFGPRDQRFKVTAKGASRDAVVVQWRLAAPFLALVAATLGGIAFRLLADPMQDAPPDIEAVNLFWSLFNLATLAIAILVCVEQPRYRSEERFATDEPASLLLPGGPPLEGRLMDLSITGGAVELASAPAVREGEVTVILGGIGPVRASIRRVRGRRLHLVFTPTAEARRDLIRKLFSGDYVRPVTRTPLPELVAVIGRRLLS